MNSSDRKQRGQALVLIVLAIVGMVGLTGLAIDGGNAYSDRRHAQNAADTAAMAAALSKVRGADVATFTKAATDVATANGYTANPETTVDVYVCDTPHTPECIIGAGENAANFVQVVISTTVHTYFAPVLGIRELHNHVQAIARAIPSVPEPWYNGSALVALMPGCKDAGWNADPFTVSGSQVTVVNGTGVFVNSTCSNAFVQNGNNSLTSAAGICVVGGVGPTTGINPVPQANCGTQLDLSAYTLPPLDDSSCDGEGNNGNGYISDLGGGNYFAHPGRYTSTFPPGPSGNLKIGQGIYCLEHGISVQGGWNLTTDLNGDGATESNEGALFFVKGGGVDIAGGSNMYLHAISTTSTGLGSDLVNYLMYLPPTNTNPVKITGGTSSNYIGTILAPGSLVTLNGGSGTDSLNMQTQVIGYSLVLTGNSNLTITYDQARQAMTQTNPSLTPYK